MVNNVSLPVTERETALWIHVAEIVFGRFQSQSESAYTHNALQNLQDDGTCKTGYRNSQHQVVLSTNLSYMLINLTCITYTLL